MPKSRFIYGVDDWLVVEEDIIKGNFIIDQIVPTRPKVEQIKTALRKGWGYKGRLGKKEKI